MFSGNHCYCGERAFCFQALPFRSSQGRGNQSGRSRAVEGRDDEGQSGPSRKIPPYDISIPVYKRLLVMYVVSLDLFGLVVCFVSSLCHWPHLQKDNRKVMLGKRERVDALCQINKTRIWNR